MVYKTTLLAIFIFAMVSCKQHKTKGGNDHFIIGKWEMCQTIYLNANNQGNEISFNVCPQIIFKENHKGFIKRSDPRLLYFNWTFNNDHLKIEHYPKSKDNDLIIDDGIFKIVQTKNKTFQEIEIIDTVKNVKYILGGRH